MDNARWLVILSVVLSMAVALTLLNRYSASLRPAIKMSAGENVVAVQQRPAEINKPVARKSSRREIPRYSQISFPKPAAHTLVVEQSREIEKMNESLNVEGQIIR